MISVAQIFGPRGDLPPHRGNLHAIFGHLLPRQQTVEPELARVPVALRDMRHHVRRPRACVPDQEEVQPVPLLRCVGGGYCNLYDFLLLLRSCYLLFTSYLLPTYFLLLLRSCLLLECRRANYTQQHTLAAYYSSLPPSSAVSRFLQPV